MQSQAYAGAETLAATIAIALELLMCGWMGARWRRW